NIDLNFISKHSNDVICIVPYESRRIYKDLNKMFKYVFIGYKNEEEKLKIKSSNTVYMNEVLCLDKEDEVYLKYLQAIKKGKIVSDVIFDKDNVSLFPLTHTNEENNKKICELCNLEIPFHQDLMPKIESSYDILKKKCVEGLKNKFGLEAPRIYVERLKKELNIINKMGFCDYFLIVADYIDYARNNNILVGPGRGSAAGSLAGYLINITTIDPIKYNLLFERFLNPERVTMPDIDVDFEDVKRDRVIDYCVNKYGLKKVAPIITFGTLGSRQALRDVGRACDVSLKKVDNLCKKIDPRFSLKDNFKHVKSYLDFNSELKKVYKIALKFEGLKRHTSIHAAGIVMSNLPLDEVIPLDKGHDNFYTTGYDMTYLEEIGLLKMDFLGLKNLSLINNILSEIDGITFESIPENDFKALKIFEDVNTVGIFQFESDGMMNFLKKFKPKSFEDIVSALALFRPGPMQNIETYIRRSRGIEKVSYIHPDLEKILKPTYGIIIYQEQIMQIANVMAGYSMAEADILRRAMSKKKESVLLKEKNKFIRQSVDRGYEKQVATDVYDLILKFASYGFNRSHSVSYAMIAYRMAYLKANYPLIFMKNLLSSAINSDSKTKEYIYECKKNNLAVRGPSINLSEDNYIIDDGVIVFPLTNIKNVGIGAVKAILEERAYGKFKDIFDFVRRCGKNINSKVLENLILASSFDGLGYNKQTLINNLEIIINYGELGELLDDDFLKPELEIYPEYSKAAIMNYELLVFGFYLSNHPVTEYRLRESSCVEIKKLDEYFDKVVSVIVYVDKTSKITTKKNETMLFISGFDELSKIDIVVFPKVYEKYSFVSQGDVLKVTGKVEKRFDKLQLVANIVEKLN
ncbi:MAG: DNA polymerase III subunit alpha, partial [Bacilli bacterium]|nr:DNA polymerase III subunit alpha [Bacilli bacterium]